MSSLAQANGKPEDKEALDVVYRGWCPGLPSRVGKGKQGIKKGNGKHLACIFNVQYVHEVKDSTRRLSHDVRSPQSL